MAVMTTEPPPSATRPLTAESQGEKNMASLFFLVLLWLSLAFGILVLIVLIVTTFIDGLPRMDSKLFTNYTSQINPEDAGARAAILGTLWVIATTAVLAIPIGIAAAAYLEEFASKTSR